MRNWIVMYHKIDNKAIRLFAQLLNRFYWWAFREQERMLRERIQATCLDSYAVSHYDQNKEGMEKSLQHMMILKSHLCDLEGLTALWQATHALNTEIVTKKHNTQTRE